MPHPSQPNHFQGFGYVPYNSQALEIRYIIIIIYKIRTSTVRPKIYQKFSYHWFHSLQKIILWVYDEQTVNKKRFRKKEKGFRKI